MAKMMLVGKTNTGKTSLIQMLNEERLYYKKTQAAEYYENFLDLPGEYLENPRYYNAIISMSFDVDIIALVHSVDSDMCVFPPNFGDMFNVKVVGIVTKVDLASDLNHLNQVREYLLEAGSKEIYEVSAVTKEGVDAIKNLIWNQ